MTVSGVILAAGLSRRLGRPKQLLPLAGKPLIWWTATNALASHLDEVLVVVGGAADDVSAAISSLPVRVIQNDCFAEGQSTSLRAGVCSLAANVAAAVFLLGDQPEVSATVIDALIDEHAETNALIVQPVYRGTPGNPVLFDHRLFAELKTVEGDQGARSFLRRGPGWVRRVAVDEVGPPADIDTDEDYRELIARWAAIRSR